MLIILPKHSDGILLREFVTGDAEPPAEIEFDAEVKKYLAVPSRDREEWIRNFSPSVMTGCIIVALPENVVAGHISITRTETQGIGELRIVVGKTFWGRGLGRKAANLIIPAAFYELHAISIKAVVHPENKASLELIQSMGFINTGEVVDDLNHWQHGHLIYVLDQI
jgi:RimJ/RimL family protein N-acetyltransferase